jgi:hypothetical protein
MSAWPLARPTSSSCAPRRPQCEPPPARAHLCGNGGGARKTTRRGRRGPARTAHPRPARGGRLSATRLCARITSSARALGLRRRPLLPHRERSIRRGERARSEHRDRSSARPVRRSMAMSSRVRRAASWHPLQFQTCAQHREPWRRGEPRGDRRAHAVMQADSSKDVGSFIGRATVVSHESGRKQLQIRFTGHWPADAAD